MNLTINLKRININYNNLETGGFERHSTDRNV